MAKKLPPRGERREVKERAPQHRGPAGARVPHPTLNCESATEYVRTCRPLDQVEALMTCAELARDRPERLTLVFEDKQRIARLARELLFHLADFQGTAEGRGYPWLPQQLGFLLRLAALGLGNEGKSGLEAQMLKSDRLLDFGMTALAHAERNRWKQPTATELAALAVARGLQEPTPDKAVRVDLWRKRLATAERLIHQPIDVTQEETKNHWNRIAAELCVSRPWLNIVWPMSIGKAEG